MAQHVRLDADPLVHHAKIVVTEDNLKQADGSRLLADETIVVTQAEVGRASARARLSEIATPNLLLLVAQLVAGTRLHGLRHVLLGAAIWRTIRRNLRRKGPPDEYS